MAAAVVAPAPVTFAFAVCTAMVYSVGSVAQSPPERDELISISQSSPVVTQVAFTEQASKSVEASVATGTAHTFTEKFLFVSFVSSQPSF